MRYIRFYAILACRGSLRDKYYSCCFYSWVCGYGGAFCAAGKKKKRYVQEILIVLDVRDAEVRVVVKKNKDITVCFFRVC